MPWARQPVIQPQRVGGRSERSARGQACTALAHAVAQCLGVGHASFHQRGRQVDALAVLRQPHQHRHIDRRAAADAEVNAVDQAVEPLGGIELAIDEAIAQRRPRVLAVQVEGKSVGLGEALGGGDDERGCIGERHEPEVETVLFGGVAAVDPGEGVRAGKGNIGHESGLVVCCARQAGPAGA